VDADLGRLIILHASSDHLVAAGVLPQRCDGGVSAELADSILTAWRNRQPATRPLADR
jgi:hypothetical protein